MGDEIETSAEHPDSTTRRRLMATAGALGAGALAGCTGEDNGGGGDGKDGGPSRPTPDGINADDLDPVLLFIVRSHDYQNQLLEREYGGGG